MRLFTKGLLIAGAAVATLITAKQLFWSDPQRPLVAEDPLKAPKASEKASISQTAEPIVKEPKIEVSEPQLQRQQNPKIVAIMARFAAGDYGTALKLARQYQNDPPSRVWIGREMPGLLAAAAYLLINQSQCEQALPLLKEARRLQESDLVWKGLAVCQHRLGNLAAAEEQTMRFLETHPQDREMRLLAADIFESLGDYTQAARMIKAIPNPDTALTKRAETMSRRASASESQDSVESPHFRLTYEADSHSIIASEVLRLLESTLEDYIRLFRFRPPTTPIETLLYPKSKFETVMPDGPKWAGGLFDGRLRIPVREDWLGAELTQTPLANILRHELSHALLSQMTAKRPLPTWLDEAIAQRVACHNRDCPQLTPHKKPRYGKFFPLADFEAPFVSFTQKKAERIYRQSLYMLYWLEARDPSQQILAEIVERLTPQLSLTSNEILRPTQLTFAQLHKKVAKNWDFGNVLP